MILKRFKNSIFILILPLLLFFIFSIFNPLYSENNKNFQFRKNHEIQRIKPKKPVKIKLKRSATGKYTWDLTGDDVDEIVRVDKSLRKQLNTE